jgi:hypothetical protein
MDVAQRGDNCQFNVSRSDWLEYYGKREFVSNSLVNYMVTECSENNVKWSIPSFGFDNFTEYSLDFVWVFVCHKNISDVVWDLISMTIYRIWSECLHSTWAVISHIKMHQNLTQISLTSICMKTNFNPALHKNESIYWFQICLPFDIKCFSHKIVQGLVLNWSCIEFD